LLSSLNPRTFKKALIIFHDLMMTIVAIIASLALRFQDSELLLRLQYIHYTVPFAAFAGIIYFMLRLYNSKWRFASLADLITIVKASAIMVAFMAVADYFASKAIIGQFLGFRTLTIYFFLQMALLGGPRIFYRYWKDSRAYSASRVIDATPTLFIGRSSEIEVLLRLLETNSNKTLRPIAILSQREQDRGQIIRGIEVRGTVADLEDEVANAEVKGTPIRKIVMTSAALVAENQPEKVLDLARQLGIPVLRMLSLEGDSPGAMAPVEIEDLLLRPIHDIDSVRVARFIRGKRIVVTGGGGSIGAEICRRLKNYGASSILIIENSEPALHAITEELDRVGGNTDVTGHIADVRDRKRITDLMVDFRPDVVFHSAALKHVPYLERDWSEGIKTNIFGSINVADAAVAAKVTCMVLISTDKAIRPVSMLGATKRLAEIVTESMDRKLNATRLISVRFGNVLGSNGSVVPKFKAQIAAGGPVTVTHPEMVRYFMTIREACDLVLTAASHAAVRPKTEVNPSVYVLKMGQPVKVLDLAQRMIRLSGFEPGRDIRIEFTGIRPGERLHEILFDEDEPMVETGLSGIVAAQTRNIPPDQIKGWLNGIKAAMIKDDIRATQELLATAVPNYNWGTPEQAALPAEQRRNFPLRVVR
jgi:FlaA1/EpsC-like NDP-sugar epimerase